MTERRAPRRFRHTQIAVAATRLHAPPPTKPAANASLVMVGAYLAVTGLVTLERALTAVDDALPSYRKQHVPGCQQALRTGHEAAPTERVDAWAGVSA